MITGSDGSGKAFVCGLNQQLRSVRYSTNKHCLIEVAVETTMIRCDVNYSSSQNHTQHFMST